MASNAPPLSASVLSAKSVAAAAGDDLPNGLTSDEARRRLEKFGPNAMPDTSVHPLRMALEKFWAPVPWMLEAAIVLELVLGKYVEAAIIAGLLVFNAALGLFQESRAQATLAALKSRLALTASVRRDGAWKTVPAAELVPGDVVKLSLGGVVAADVHLTGGEILLDQSMLTGESVPIEAGAGVQTYAGALVRRGEAVAEVTATGARTKFGRTAELVRTAHVVSSQQKAVLRVVRNLAAFNGVVIVMLVAYAYFLKMPLAEIIPLVLTAVLGIDTGRAAGHLHPGVGARRAGPGKAGRASDPPLRGGRSGDDGCPVRRQDRHADAQRADGDDRPSHARLRRGACSGAGRAGQFGWRAGPGRCAPFARPPRQGSRRCAETGQVRAVRSGDEDVRGDGHGPERRHATHREGRLCRGHRPRPAVADRDGGGEGTGGTGLPGAGGRRRTAERR